MADRVGRLDQPAQNAENVCQLADVRHVFAKDDDLDNVRDDPRFAAIQREARRVNDRFQQNGWLPIELVIEDDFAGSVAAYKQFDALFVNAIFDGMNLVAKEAPLVNERDGVLILSENAGAHAELGEWALTVNPFDVAGQAEAIHMANDTEFGASFGPVPRSAPWPTVGRSASCFSPKLTAPSHCSRGGPPSAILRRSSTSRSAKWALTMPSTVRRSSSEGTRPRSRSIEPLRDADHAVDQHGVVLGELARRDIRIVLVADADVAAERDRKRQDRPLLLRIQSYDSTPRQSLSG